MQFFRLALPLAALAAVVSMNFATAEENPVRQFLNEEFNASSVEQNDENDKSAPTQLASVSDEQKSNTKTNANPWAGMIKAVAVAPAVAPTTGASASVIALIDKHAAANGLPAAFARAIVRIESNFNPRATGRQKEVGLMQIKFETARGIGFTGTREELYDPDTNLKWGMKYLGMAWKLGGNTPCGAVMKYQGGHGVNRMSAAANAYCAKVKSHMASAN